METEEYILSLVTAHTLLLLDRGFYHFSFWLKLIEQKVDFVTRLKKGAAIQVEQVFTDSYEEARQKGVVVSVHYPKKVCGLTTSFNG